MTETSRRDTAEEALAEVKRRLASDGPDDFRVRTADAYIDLWFADKTRIVAAPWETPPEAPSEPPPVSLLGTDGRSWGVSTELCVECPDCGFTFSADHPDADSDLYSCPACPGPSCLSGVAGCDGDCDAAHEREMADAEPEVPSDDLVERLAQEVAAIQSGIDGCPADDADRAAVRLVYEAAAAALRETR